MNKQIMVTGPYDEVSLFWVLLAEASFSLQAALKAAVHIFNTTSAYTEKKLKLLNF